MPQKIISDQISTLRIFPTIFDLVQMPQKDYFRSKSLAKLINNQNDLLGEEIFLHTSPYEKESSTDMIGIRTGKYKFFRHARNSEKNINLYDLENDPYENNNLAKNNYELVCEMEELLKKNQKNVSYPDSEISMEEEKEISKELRKLGYL